MYATTEFHAVSLFSMRALHANAFSARTLPCPTPAAVKMALLAKLLERDGQDRAQATLDWLAPLAVLWRPPERIAVSTTTVRIYKSDGGDQDLTASKGMREYACLGGPFALSLGSVPDAFREDLADALGQLRALGNAESLVQPLGPPVWSLAAPEAAIDLSTDSGGQGRGFAVVVDDLGEAPEWRRLNVYRVHERRNIPQIGPDRVRRIVTLPFEVVRWSETGYVLERIAG